QVAGSVSTTVGSSFTFNGGPTTIQGGVYGMPSSLAIFNNDVLIQGQDTAQQGNYALSGVQNQIVFNGNTVINGPVLGNGSSFQFSTTSSTSMGALTLAGGAQIAGGSIGNPIQILGDAYAYGGSLLGGNLDIAGQLNMGAA